MKEKIQNTKMFDENMKEKRAISRKIAHKRKSYNNISFSTFCNLIIFGGNGRNFVTNSINFERIHY